MRAVFASLLLVLAAATVLTVATTPEMRSDVPVLYWVTDNNPARAEQIRLFHEWLVDNGYTTSDGGPAVQLRLDTASRDDAKQIIQGVSGVAGDIMDCDITRLQSLGLLADVTAPAGRLGFDVSRTYPALEPLLTVGGRQYGFPCNVNSRAYWANVDTFRRVGMQPPPRTWDYETFERIGREFVRRSNPPAQRRRIFFAEAVRSYMGRPIVRVMHRGLGLSVFNETLTRCTLDDERYARVLRRIHKWTCQDRILPSAADEASFAAESGYGGASLSLFQHGRYGMISIGRWCLIRIRKFPHPCALSVSYYPCEGFANTPINARTAGIYAGGRHVDRAVLFLAFLAGRPYNDHVVRDADALPPNPAATRSADYLRPPEHPNEWGCHEVPVASAETTAIAQSVSPFVARATVDRYKDQGLEKVMAGLARPEEAASWAAGRINDEIARTLAESTLLRRRYDELAAVQEQIEQRRRTGRKVPLAWIRNPFHRRYYPAMGWAGEDRP